MQEVLQYVPNAPEGLSNRPLTADYDLGQGIQNRTIATLFTMLYLSLKFDEIHFAVSIHLETQSDLLPLTVTLLSLSMGTLLLSVTSHLIYVLNFLRVLMQLAYGIF